jgi:uncharacterized protein involved in response to NO
MNTHKPGNSISQFALFNLGFRPFFLGAGAFAIVSIAFWAVIYLSRFTLPLVNITPSQWHAHEMIYGYSLAVIAGFLLTAVKNWTGIPTLGRQGLIILFSCWLAVRLLWLTGSSWLIITAILDTLFCVILLIAISVPVIKKRQWVQIAIISKVMLLMVFNGLFYLGAFNLLQQGIFWGLMGGLYLVVGLILTMGRRVVPFFIEKGVAYRVTLPNSKWLDISSMLLFVGFFISELFLSSPGWSSAFSLGVFLVNAIRLLGWHTPGIWGKPLLWGLYLSLWLICLGFLMFALDYYIDISRYLPLHALAFGGIGLVTMSMMARVSLGHTGRDVASPPPAISLALLILSGGAVIRIFMPYIAPGFYDVWIGLSALLWCIAFLIFTLTYLPMLSGPRVDGQPG